jgi:hypothetical protein
MTASEIDEVKELIVRLVQSQLSAIQFLPESKRARATKQFENGLVQCLHECGYGPRGAS